MSPLYYSSPLPNWKVHRRNLKIYWEANVCPPVAAPESNPSIIERISPTEKHSGYLRVKPQYKFHLYINTAPCGDARIFSPHETEAEQQDPHPNRQCRGVLRTKIESGEGTIPIKVSNIPLLQGIIVIIIII